MPTKIIDTNVILVANGQHQNVTQDCVALCALHLQSIMRQERIALDDGFRILNEYQKKTTPKRGNRPGDAFVKWALRNSANSARCDQVLLRENSAGEFDSFPSDTTLQQFDPADKKYIAVAAAHPDHPPISQATGSKWLQWAPALKRHDIKVDFICREDIETFHRNKFGP